MSSITFSIEFLRTLTPTQFELLTATKPEPNLATKPEPIPVTKTEPIPVTKTAPVSNIPTILLPKEAVHKARESWADMDDDDEDMSLPVVSDAAAAPHKPVLAVPHKAALAAAVPKAVWRMGDNKPAAPVQPPNYSELRNELFASMTNVQINRAKLAGPGRGLLLKKGSVCIVVYSSGRLIHSPANPLAGNHNDIVDLVEITHGKCAGYFTATVPPQVELFPALGAATHSAAAAPVPVAAPAVLSAMAAPIPPIADAYDLREFGKSVFEKLADGIKRRMKKTGDCYFFVDPTEKLCFIYWVKEYQSVFTAELREEYLDKYTENTMAPTRVSARLFRYPCGKPTDASTWEKAPINAPVLAAKKDNGAAMNPFAKLA